jgi:hypothetical protein
VLQGAPVRVWTALTDRAQRDAWGPLVDLDDTARAGPAHCGWAVKGLARPVRMAATIDRFEKPEIFAWSCGLPGVYVFTELFELSGDDGGTSMMHSISARGLLGRLLGPMILKRMHKLMLESDERLEKYLRWRIVRAPARAQRAARPTRRKGKTR